MPQEAQTVNVLADGDPDQNCSDNNTNNDDIRLRNHNTSSVAILPNELMGLTSQHLVHEIVIDR